MAFVFACLCLLIAFVLFICLQALLDMDASMVVDVLVPVDMCLYLIGRGEGVGIDEFTRRMD